MYFKIADAANEHKLARYFLKIKTLILKVVSIS